MTVENILSKIKSKLIVSCQAPINSPLHDPQIIAAIAQASVNNGAAAVRIDTPAHVKAVRQQIPHIPLIGLWKQQISGYEVYITPTLAATDALAHANADIIAIDATDRQRPNHESVTQLIEHIHTKLGKLVMADVDSIENAIAATQAGADIVATTLYGYTKQTQVCNPPGWELLSQMVAKLDIPVICEGGIASPAMAQKALQLGAYAVVVGTAIAGIDHKVKEFQAIFAG
ncbi:MAG: N-acetylmannosamine-6-phosphate 2-epimerase [Oscillatoria sp. PMC 1051.18]|nr:N-acetylmannosamine-6-phosphate 2-epimerase [Oscillatoria sp. PMC 1050.18]MEC5028512.1 N-acetylmannosamine-6-phosphate 2-epimerase [Oscillatoria sp. PMC 1051.18]